MADIVQMRLEQMLPEIEDLEKKKIFNKAELTSIINKRKRFEYFLARRIPKKIDFLRYIEFELNLDALRKKRKDRIIAAAKANQKLLKSKGDDKTKEDIEKSEFLVNLMRVTLSDYSILRHVHSLYNRALKRFPGDVELWVQYLEWAQKSSNSKLLGKVFPRVISLHPTKDIFWIMAASWEFEKNGNALSGRTLLQRGLRINGESKKLWLEYFRLELLYLEKLRERRKILFGKTNENNEESTENGEDEDSKMEDIELSELELEKQSKNSGDILQQRIAELAEKTAKANAEEVLHPAFQAETDAQKAFFSGAIPKLIFKNAINAIKDDLKFRLDFIRIYNRFGNWTSEGINEIYESIKEDFKNNEEAQAILCERFVNNIDVNDSEFPLKLKMSIDAFETSVAEINNKKIWQCYKDFLQKYLEMCEEENLKLYLDKSIQRLYQRAQEKNMLSEEMYLSWLEYIAEEEDEKTKEKQEVDIIQKGLTAYPNSAKLLYQSLSKELSTHSNEEESLIPKLEKAIGQVPAQESYELWDLYLNYLKEEMEAGHIESDEINQKFKNTISTIRLDDVDYENYVLSKYLEWSKDTFDMPKFRTIVKDLITSKQRSLQFFEKCLEIELLSGKKEDSTTDIVIDDIMEVDEDAQNPINSNGTGINKFVAKILNKEITLDANKLNLDSISYLFEKAIATDITNIDLWLAYVVIEMKFNKSLNFASELYVRALNELKYNASDVVSQLFEKKYQEIKTKL